MSDVPRFGIGDFVWFACYAVATIEEPCPVCFGKKAVTLILGNGEGWIIPCDYCAKGYMEPRGTVSVSEIGPQVRGYTIDRVSVSATAVEYQSWAAGRPRHRYRQARRSTTRPTFARWVC